MSPPPLLLITPPWKENIGRTDPKFFNNFPESFGHASPEMSTSPPPLTPINQMRKYPVMKARRGYSGYYGYQNKRPCSVCGDLAPNHLHYGGVACFSCRCVLYNHILLFVVRAKLNISLSSLFWIHFKWGNCVRWWEYRKLVSYPLCTELLQYFSIIAWFQFGDISSI